MKGLIKEIEKAWDNYFHNNKQHNELKEELKTIIKERCKQCFELYLKEKNLEIKAIIHKGET